MSVCGRNAGVLPSLRLRRPGWLLSERDLVVVVVLGAHAGWHGLELLVVLDLVARSGLAGAEELHVVGDDLDRLSLGAVLGLPLSPLQTAVDRDGAALREEASAALRLRAEHLDVEEVRPVLPFAGLAILAARVARDAHLAQRCAARQILRLRVLREIPGQYYSVYVARSHVAPSFLLCSVRLPLHLVWCGR